MTDFVSASATHAYVRLLEQRIADLERVVALRLEKIEPHQETDRKAYMRDYMRRKRAEQRVTGGSSDIPDTASPNA